MAKKKLTRAKSSKKAPGGKPSPLTTRAARKQNPAVDTHSNNGLAASSEIAPPRLLPTVTELRSLYDRYTGGAKFDEHDKAFYFVLDVGGVSRAKQLLAHVEEVLAEIEEFH